MPHTAPLHPQDQRALLVALVLIVIWGGNFTLQKYLFDLITPGGFLWARYLIMPTCALLLMRWRFGHWLPPLPRKDWMQMAWLGFLGHSLHVGLVTYGIHWSTAFSSSVILACGPILTLLILRYQGLERLTAAQMSGVALAFGGVLIFLSDKLLGGNWRAGGGDLILLVAAAFFSYYTVAVKPVMEKHGPVLTMGYATLLGGLPVMLLSVPAGMSANWGRSTFGHGWVCSGQFWCRPSSAGWPGVGSTPCAAWPARPL